MHQLTQKQQPIQVLQKTTEGGIAADANSTQQAAGATADTPKVGGDTTGGMINKAVEGVKEDLKAEVKKAAEGAKEEVKKTVEGTKEAAKELMKKN